VAALNPVHVLKATWLVSINTAVVPLEVLYKVYPLYCCALIEELAIMTMNDNAYMIFFILFVLINVLEIAFQFVL
jgi:hypothetical protein